MDRVIWNQLTIVVVYRNKWRNTDLKKIQILSVDIRKLKKAEIKFMIHTAVYSPSDYRRNEGTLELKVDSVERKLS